MSARERARPLRGLRLWATAAVLMLVGSTIAIALVAKVERDTVTAAQRRFQLSLRPTQAAEAQLLTAYVTQETGQRGFLLTGDESFLQTYAKGRADATALQARLATLTETDATERTELAEMIAAGRDWQQRSAEPEIAARRADPLDPAEVRALTTTGEQFFDAFRTKIAALMARTDALITSEVDRVSRAQSDARLAANLALTGAITVAVLAIALLWYLFTRPIGRFLGEIQAVAAGDYTRPLSTRGPQEVTIIAAAVDRMRDGLVQKNAEAVANQQLLSVRQERDRMATDLHDLTIQRIFGLGLALNSTVAHSPDVADELEPLVDETDAIIRELRNVIFALGAAEDTIGLRAGVIEIVRDSARSFGFLPELDLRGPLDTAIPAELAADLLAALREALSNAARHAHASSVRVLLTYSDDTVNLVVTDDGTGIPEIVVPGGGSVNLRSRAERRGGNASIRQGPSGGTVVHWWVPVT